VDNIALSKSFICPESAVAGLTFAIAKRDKASRATLLRRNEKDLTQRSDVGLKREE
jgi:uncharacterized membrane protein YvbJ